MTTLFLSTTGGHLEQLAALAARIPVDGPEVWVTHENDQGRSLLGGRDVEYVPYVQVGSVPDVARCVPTAHRVWRERSVTRVISTGSGIALGYLPYLTARGVPCHYIESAARVAAPSRTGRVLATRAGSAQVHPVPALGGPPLAPPGQRLGRLRTVRPLPPADRRGPCRRHGGNGGGVPLGRLIERLVPLLAPDGALARATGLPVDVLWQTGCTPTGHLPITALDFLPAEKLAATIEDAHLVVSHAGVGRRSPPWLRDVARCWSDGPGRSGRPATTTRTSWPPSCSAGGWRSDRPRGGHRRRPAGRPGRRRAPDQ